MKVAAYIRVSTDEQAKQDISLPMQQSRLLSYCEARQWTMHDYYIEDGYSGKDLNRPAVKRLISDANQKKFDIVLVWKLDRLSRRQQHVMYLIEDVFLPNKIDFVSVTESIDTSTPAGRAMIGVLAIFAQLERETIIERVTESKQTAASQGRFMGGPAPFGYAHDKANKSLVIEPLHAEIIKTIYNLYLTGKYGYESIMHVLEERKIPPPSAKQWNDASVRKILTNAIYMGKIEHKGIMYKAKHDPIIDEQLWYEVQGIIKARGGRRPTPENNGLINGIVYCAECGNRMRYKMVKQKFPIDNPTTSRYYACYSQEKGVYHMVKDRVCKSGYKHVDVIDQKVIDQLMRLSFDEKLLERVTNSMLKSNDTTAKLQKVIEKAQKEYSGIDKKVERWATAFEDGAIDIAEYHQRTKELKEKREYLLSEITRIENETAATSEKVIAISDIKEALRNFAAVWEIMPGDERKALVQNLIKRVDVNKDGDVSLEFEI